MKFARVRGLFWAGFALLAVATFLLLSDRAEAVPLTSANADMQGVCTDAAGGAVLWSDVTAAANNVNANDVSLGKSNGLNGVDAAVFGMTSPFNALWFNIGDPGVGAGATWTWTYWNGAWTTFTPASDGTNIFRTSGTNSVTFTPPADWATTEVDVLTCTGTRYYVRVEASGYNNGANFPVATQISGVLLNLRVKVQDELNTPITGLSSSAFSVTAGTLNTVYGIQDQGAGFYKLALDTRGGNDVNFNVAARPDGYVQSGTQATGNMGLTVTDLSGTPYTVNFGYKVTSVQSEISSSLTGVTVKAATGFTVTCTESGGAWYCAVPLANTGLGIQAEKDGYVTNGGSTFPTDRALNTDAQVLGSISGVQFAYKVTEVTTEGPGTSLTSVAVRTGTSYGTPCTESGGDWYCAVPVADLGISIQAEKDGYVTNEDGSFFSDRTDNADPQVSSAVSGVLFAVKVTDVSNELGGALSGVNVATGDGFLTNCTEFTGDWYCAVPVGDTGTDIKATKDGYGTTTVTGAFTDRAANSDPQALAAVSGVQFAVKVTNVSNELGAALSGVAVTTGDGFLTSCTESGGAWYCPVPVADTATDVKAVKDGYVTKTVTGAFTDRTTDEDPQRLASVSGVQFAVKVLDVTDELGGTLSGAAVTTGDGFLTSCAESGGDWYCAVLVGDTATDVKAAKDGYVAKTAASAFADRTTNDDPQRLANNVSSVQFAVKVTSVTNEIGGSLPGVDVNTGNGFLTSCSESGGAWYCAVPVVDSATDVRAIKSGYVMRIATSAYTDRTTNDDPQRTASVSGVQFAVKVLDVTDELGGTLSGAAVTTGDGFLTSCAESGGDWYCAVPVTDTATDVRAAMDGYVMKTATAAFVDRDDNADPQETASVTSVEFAFKVTGVTTEASTSLTGVTVKAGDGFGTTCQESAGAWYCPVPLANTNRTIQAAKDGYVTDAGSLFPSDRTAATDPQVSGSVSAMKFAFKVTGVTTEASTSLTGVTVKAGDGFGTTCQESAGAWYCPVLLADTALLIQAAKDGYVTDTGSSFPSDRDALDDPQVTASVSAVQFAYKVTSLTTEASASLTAATVKTGNALGVTCTEFSGAWYCVVPEAHTGLGIEVTKDGYATHTAASFSTDRTSGADPQQATTVTGVQYTLKVVIVTHPNLSGITFDKKIGAGGFNPVTPDGSLANAAFFAQTPSETDLVYKATKAASTDETGTFNVTSTSQTVQNLSLTLALTDVSTNATSVVAGAQTTYTFGFTSDAAWPADGKLVLTFPSGFAFGSPSASLTGADGGATVGVSGLVLTVTRNGAGGETPVATPVTVALTQVTNPGVSGATGTFALDLQNGASATLAIGTAPSVTLDPGALTNLSTSPGSVGASATTTYTFGFRNANPWGANGKVTIDFPAGYSVAAPTATLTGADGTATAAVAGSLVTVTRSNDGNLTVLGTDITVAVTGVTNPGTVGPTGTFAVALKTNLDVTIDLGTAPNVTIGAGNLDEIIVTPASVTLQPAQTQSFTAAGEDAAGNPVPINPTWSATCGSVNATGSYTAPNNIGTCTVSATVGSIVGNATVTVSVPSLTSVSTSASNLGTGVQTSYAFKFKSSAIWPSTGKFLVTFSGNYTIGTPTVTLAGATGTATAAVNGQTVTVTRTGNGANTPANTLITVTLTQITNPNTAGSSGVFPLVLRNGADLDLRSGNGPAVTITTAKISATLTVGSYGVDAVTTYTVRFNNPIAWPNDAKFLMTFPAKYTLSAPNVTVTGADGGMTLSVAGQVITVARDGDGTVTPQGTPLTFAFGNIRNPPHHGPSGTFPIAQRSLAGVDLSSGTLGSITITTGKLQPLTTRAESIGYGVETSYKFTFKAPQVWPADGKFSVDFTSGFTVSNPTATLSGVDGTATAVANGLNVLVTRAGDGTASTANAVITVTVTGVTNPATGRGGPFPIAIRTGANVDIGATNSPLVIYQADSLVFMSVKPKSLAQNVQTYYAFGFRPARPWPVDGKFTVTLPEGYVVGASPVVTFSGFTGTVSASTSGQTVTVTRNANGAVALAGTSMTITITQITNPPYAGTFGPFAMAIQDAGGTNINTGDSPTVKIPTGGLSPLSTTLGDRKAGATTTYTFGLKNGHPWPVDGKLNVTFPTANAPNGFSIGSPTVTLGGANGGATATVSGTTVTVTRSGNGGVTPAGTSITVQITDVTNTLLVKYSGTFSLALQDGQGRTLDVGTAPRFLVTANPMALTSLTSTSHPANTWKAVTSVVLTWKAPSAPNIDGYSYAMDAAPDGTADMGPGTTVTLTNVLEGQHTFQIRARDSTGSWGPIVKVTGIWIDTTPPDTAPTITSTTHPTTGCTALSTGTFQWSGGSDALSGLATTNRYGYNMDAQAVKRVSGTSVTLSGLTSGTHTLTVRVYDKAGNSTPDTYTFDVC